MFLLPLAQKLPSLAANVASSCAHARAPVSLRAYGKYSAERNLNKRKEVKIILKLPRTQSLQISLRNNETVSLQRQSTIV